MHAYMSVRMQTQLVYSINCLFNTNLLYLYISLTVFSLFCITLCLQSVLYHSQSSVCSVSLTVFSLFCITHCRQYHSRSSQSLTVIPVNRSLILCSVNSLSIMHFTAHTIWPAAVYFCMAIITICAHFRASYSALNNHFRIPCGSWYAYRHVWREKAEGFASAQA